LASPWCCSFKITAPETGWSMGPRKILSLGSQEQCLTHI
jgi:hypothetical protein